MRSSKINISNTFPENISNDLLIDIDFTLYICTPPKSNCVANCLLLLQLILNVVLKTSRLLAVLYSPLLFNLHKR